MPIRTKFKKKTQKYLAVSPFYLNFANHMEKQRIIFTSELKHDLTEEITRSHYDRLYVLTDETTRRFCWPLVESLTCLADAQLICIGEGEEHKTLESVVHVWRELQRHGASRQSLLVNLGGGMVTDLGGFAATTFKRGLHFINIPTTLLAMVDASVGGKTGINFEGLKNEVGVFRNAECVVVCTEFLKTLDHKNQLSGYAEMLKHALLTQGEMLSRLLRLDLSDERQLSDILPDNIAVKQRIVLEDPNEQGIRKALNLGHTFGHAFESLALRQHHIPHGFAVAYGLVCELYLSVIKMGFPVERMRQVVRFIKENYGQMAFSCDDYPTLLELMVHDKKNAFGRINFTLLADVGDIHINQTATKNEIEEAFDFLREG